MSSTILGAPALGLLSILLIGSSGCSFLFTTQAPSDEALARAPGPFECTSSPLWPIVDTTSAAYDVARMGIALSRKDSDYADQPLSRSTEIALGAGFAALNTASAIYGYVVTARCRAVKRGPPYVNPPLPAYQPPGYPPPGYPPLGYPPPGYPPPGYPPPGAGSPSALPSSTPQSNTSRWPQAPAPPPASSAPPRVPQE
jgi:hypothetical protein